MTRCCRFFCFTFPLQVSHKKFSLHVTPRFKDALSKREEKQWRKLSSFVTMDVTNGQVDMKRAQICCPLKISPLSSVVFFGEVQRSQASKAETSTFCVKSVNFSVLTFQQVLDPFSTFLLKCGQFLLNLQSNKT